MTRKLTLILTFFPSAAFAAENGPIELAIGIGGMVILSIFVLAFANKADNAAEDPTNMEFADLDTLYSKLISQLDLVGAYNLHIVRQSGNVERTIEQLDVNEVVSQISSTMKRAKIDLVSIHGDANHLELYRVMHNGRGRQEGKRIGGFEVQKVGEYNSSVLPDNDQLLLDNADEDLPVEINLTTDSEAKKAIVKAFFYASEAVEGLPSIITDRFDPETAEGSAEIEVTDFIMFLISADQYLTGVGELTDEFRQQLIDSDASWQQAIGNDNSISTMLGITSFGSASPQEIKEEFVSLWELAELLLTLHDEAGMVPGTKELYLDLVENNRPKILDATM
jgi:hypothetical protein